MLPAVQLAIDQRKRDSSAFQFVSSWHQLARNLTFAGEIMNAIASLFEDPSKFDLIQELQIMIENYSFNQLNSTLLVKQLVAYYVGDRNSDNANLQHYYPSP